MPLRFGFDLRPLQTGARNAGIGRYTAMLSEHLWRLGLAEEAVFVGLRGRPLSTPLPLGDSGCRLLSVYRPPKPERWHGFWDRLFLERELRPVELQLFHSPRLCNFRPKRFPLIVTIHDLIYLRFPEEYFTTPDIRWAFQQAIEVARQADALVADSQATRLDIEQFLGVPAARIRVVYLGIGEEFFRIPSPERLAEVRTKFGLNEEYILNVGGFDFRKNIPRLVEAFQRLGAFRRGFRLVLAGRLYGPEVAPLRNLIEQLGLTREVVFPGSLSLEELRCLYAEAALFVYPSLCEGFGFPVLEAFAARVPVVTSNRSSLPELAGEAAVMVDPEDVGAIAQAMRRALEDSRLRETMRRAGLEQARKFSWQKTAEQTWRVYEEVAGR